MSLSPEHAQQLLHKCLSEQESGLPEEWNLAACVKAFTDAGYDVQLVRASVSSRVITGHVWGMDVEGILVTKNAIGLLEATRHVLPHTSRREVTVNAYPGQDALSSMSNLMGSFYRKNAAERSERFRTLIEHTLLEQDVPATQPHRQGIRL